MYQPGTIAVLGSANLDIVIPVPHHPVTGETVMGGDHALVPGGKGANQAVAAARLGADVSFVGRLGSDDAGATLRESLEAAGVDTTFLRDDAGAPSGIALIGVDEAGDNAIVVSPGANGRVGPEDVADAEAVIRDATVLLLQLEVPMEAVAAAARVASGDRKSTRLNSSHTDISRRPAPASRRPGSQRHRTGPAGWDRTARRRGRGGGTGPLVAGSNGGGDHGGRWSPAGHPR